MINWQTIALAIALAVVLAALLTIAGRPAPHVAPALLEATEPAHKGDMLARPGPRVVRVIPIVPPEKPLPFERRMPEGVYPEPTFAERPPAPPPKAEDPPVRHWHMGDRDVCTRHGMHKVYTHGGRSWRCK